MAHNFDSGMFVRQPAWHGLGNVIDRDVTDWNEARTLAGLDWDVREVPVFARYGTPDAPQYRSIDGQKGIVRDDNGEWLAIMNDTYTPFSNADLGPLAEALVNDPEVQYETAGSLKGGRKVWALLRLRDPFEVPGDPKGATLPYLAVQNSHDGSGSLRAQRLMTRIVCDNTSRAADAEADRHGMQYTFRHTASINDRVAEAKQVIAGLKDSRQTYLDWADDLLGIRITAEQEEAFIQMMMPLPDAAALISDRVKANVEEARGDLRRILNDGEGTTPEVIRPTAYGLVQAAGEYLDHVRGYRSDETHFSRTYLTDEPLKAKAEVFARQAALL